MNLILLEPDDFIAADRVRLRGRRFEHVRHVIRSSVGDELRVGVINGKIGKGHIESMGDHSIELQVMLAHDAPAGLPLRLVLAMPRPKVLNRTVAAAVSLGIREIDLINAWRVEKAYWNSPRLAEENLRLQSMIGLEQAADTILPRIRMHRLFAPFVREELPELCGGRLALLAHPGSETEVPRAVTQPAVLAIGPEGGFIEREIQTFRDIGFLPVTLGPRILRVETALACLVGRMF